MNPSINGEKMKQTTNHCCSNMTKYLQEQEVPLDYNPIFREYTINLNSPANLSIHFCPWCSKRLPRNLRNEFFNIIETECNIDDGVLEIFENKKLPQEFTSDVWWKKRGL